MDENLTFIYVLRLTEPDKYEEIALEKEAVINKHFERLKRALAQGKLILAGPCLDGNFGIVVFRARSKEEAKKFAENDPAVKRGVMTAELHPFKVSLIKKCTPKR